MKTIAKAAPFIALCFIAALGIHAQQKPTQINDELQKRVSLREAAYSGDLAEVQYLVSAGIDVNTPVGASNPPVVMAAIAGHEEIVTYLLDHKADADIENVSIALMRAAESGHIPIMEALLGHGAQIEHRGMGLQHGGCGWMPGEGTPLIAAAACGQSKSVELLLAKGAAIEAAGTAEKFSSIDGTALLFAAANGKQEVLRSLIAAHANVNAVSSNGYSALMWAAKGKYIGVARVLVSAGADVNVAVLHEVPVSYIRMPNGAVTYKGNFTSEEAFEKLSGSIPGAAYHHSGMERETALSLSAASGNDEFKDLLVGAGAK